MATSNCKMISKPKFYLEVMFYLDVTATGALSFVQVDGTKMAMSLK